MLAGLTSQKLDQWDAHHGTHVRQWRGYASGYVNTICFTPDSRFAVSGGADRLVRVWSVETGDCLLKLAGHEGEVKSVAVSPDGRFIASGSDDGTVRIWELVWDYEFPPTTDWDEAARPYLQQFLPRYTPYQRTPTADAELSEAEVEECLTRSSTPVWTEADFANLLVQLQHAGLGWISEAGIRSELERMASV